ncbi:MAG: NADH-quinone oxidoreductase subunit J [Muribaculaceae bacterium]|nr:NADH-quinone oxidoreductase subunit J [Muribaculaceae bacterium]
MDSVGNIILYFVVAIAMVLSAFMAVTTTKILRAATYLLFSLICTAVFYFQLGFQFLGAVQIAVYAGGIMVLFVFAIILTHKPNEKSAPLLAHRKLTGIAASVIGAVLLLVALFKMPLVKGISLAQAIEYGGSRLTMHDIGTALVGSEKFQYLLPFEAVSVLLLACIIGGVVIARKK